MNKSIPSALQETFIKQKKNIEQVLGASNLDWSALLKRFNTQYPELENHLAKSIIFSDFIASSISYHLDIFLNLLESGELLCSRHENFYIETLEELLASVENQEQWMRELRKFREREMMRFIWRDVNGLSELRQAMKEYSEFAIAAIEVSLQFLYVQHTNTYGIPRSREDQSPQKLVVLGMGKLGGHELNLSSDIDLIFFYQTGGETDGARPIENQQFFVKLAQQLIKILDEQTVDGRVFRVDMRLRPYGESGLLVLNQNAMEHYYETQGRTWERYAFIKAAWIAGDKTVAEDFLNT